MIFSLCRKNQAAYYMSIFGLGTPTRSRSHVQAGSGEHVNAMPTAAKARGIPCEKCGAGLTLEDDQL